MFTQEIRCVFFRYRFSIKGKYFENLKPIAQTVNENLSIYSFSKYRTITTTPNHHFKMAQNHLNNKFGLPRRYQGSTPSVWVEYIALALEYQPLNLGQGFPDFAAPKYITDALSATAQSSNPLLNQYTRGFGHPRLVQAISNLYTKLINRDINSQNEILVTCGAYEALFATIQGHIDTGDEVIIIEPFFDCYEPMVKTAGGIARFIPLRLKTDVNKDVITSADWVLNEEELESLFNKKTKMIIINTPHNPLGKVFNRKELQKIADLCCKWNVLCVSDEVYEWLVFDDNEHIRMCTLPGMWERTITIGSAGKTFSVTGWKIGWAYGPKELMTNLQMVHQNCVYTCATPIQEAIAIGFEIELTRLNSSECYFKSLPIELAAKRDFMSEFLIDAGMVPTIPQGGYFMVADWTKLENKINLSSETDTYRDYRFTKWMTKNLGLQGIPPTAFYSEKNKHLAENYVRYCFMKKDENLKKASELLKKIK